MSGDNRRKTRKPFQTFAFIYTIDGRPLGNCRTLDVSESGAKLVPFTADDLPAEFLLSLSTSGSVRRHCQVRWRDGEKIGVRFIFDK